MYGCFFIVYNNTIKQTRNTEKVWCIGGKSYEIQKSDSTGALRSNVCNSSCRLRILKQTTDGRPDSSSPQRAQRRDTADAAEEAPVETKDVTLKVWAPQEDQNPTDTYDKGMLAAMCDAFNEAHPEWNITYEYGVCGEDVAKDEVTKDVDAAADVYMFDKRPAADSGRGWCHRRAGRQKTWKRLRRPTPNL